MDQQRVNELAGARIGERQLFIGGGMHKPASGNWLEVVSPINGQVFASIPDAGEEDVDLAVKAARKAFETSGWARAAPRERKKVLFRLAELIEENAAELAVLGVRDNGTELGFALMAEPMSAAATFRYYAEAIDKRAGEITATDPSVLSLIKHEPVGVVGAIVPWNFPMMIGAWKIAPALASGNAVVVKPSEDASLSLLRLGELASAAGLPDGLLNIVTGRGESTGTAMGLHPDIDVISFTGSGAVGRKLLEYSARSNLKRIYLELGGKSPNIVFADCADVAQTAQASVMAMFRNSGQVCVAPSRLLVEEAIYERFLDEAVKAARAITVGNPLDLSNQVGAIATARQMEKNLSFIDEARKAGIECVTGGERLHGESGGYYLSPAIFANPPRSSRLVCEEVFGPVLTVTPFRGEEEAAALANDTPYGLSSGVWTENLGRAHRMVDALQAGVVHVNCYGGADITAPLGGVKQSGNSHDRSLHAIAKYENLKTAWISVGKRG